MTVATILRERNISSEVGMVIHIFEFADDQDGRTLNMQSYGMVGVRAVLDFDANGQIIAPGSSVSGQVVTFVTGMRTAVVIGDGP